MAKYHCTVQAYDEVVGEEQRLTNMVLIRVEADNETEALIKAKYALPKPNYRLAEMLECRPSEHPDYSRIEAMNEKMLEAMEDKKNES